jgi:hypothetical protein
MAYADNEQLCRFLVINRSLTLEAQSSDVAAISPQPMFSGCDLGMGMQASGSDWTGQHRLFMVPVLVASFLLPPLFLPLALAAGLLFALTLGIQACAVRLPALLLPSPGKTTKF